MIAAVDIGGTKISVGIIDGEGKVLARLECPTHPDRGYAEALRRITEMLRAAAETAHTSISGIGITSCPNSLSTRLMHPGLQRDSTARHSAEHLALSLRHPPETGLLMPSDCDD